MNAIQTKEGNVTQRACMLFKQISIYHCGRTIAALYRIQSATGFHSNFLHVKKYSSKRFQETGDFVSDEMDVIDGAGYRSQDRSIEGEREPWHNSSFDAETYNGCTCRS